MENAFEEVHSWSFLLDKHKSVCIRNAKEKLKTGTVEIDAIPMADKR